MTRVTETPIHEALVAFDWLVNRPIKHLCTERVRHLPEPPSLSPYGSESKARRERCRQASAVISRRRARCP